MRQQSQILSSTDENRGRHSSIQAAYFTFCASENRLRLKDSDAKPTKEHSPILFNTNGSVVIIISSTTGIVGVVVTPTAIHAHVILLLPCVRIVLTVLSRVLRPWCFFFDSWKCARHRVCRLDGRLSGWCCRLNRLCRSWDVIAFIAVEDAG